MKLLEIIKRTARFLSKEKCTYCLIGGHAASIYRSQERFTKDVDFALLAKPVSQSANVAQKAITSIGLTPIVAFIPPSKNERPRKSICMITSSPRKGETKGEIDILLPELPWIAAAVKRAQYNFVDLGFAKVPIITPEDLVIAKFYALNNAPDRFQDLDDIKEVLNNIANFDYDYCRETLKKLEISVPKAVRKYYRG